MNPGYITAVLVSTVLCVAEGSFAAFGRVVEGIEVVRAINAMPAAGQSLEPPVPIEQVARLH